MNELLVLLLLDQALNGSGPMQPEALYYFCLWGVSVGALALLFVFFFRIQDWMYERHKIKK